MVRKIFAIAVFRPFYWCCFCYHIPVKPCTMELIWISNDSRRVGVSEYLVSCSYRITGTLLLLYVLANIDVLQYYRCQGRENWGLTWERRDCARLEHACLPFQPSYTPGCQSPAIPLVEHTVWRWRQHDVHGWTCSIVTGPSLVLVFIKTCPNSAPSVLCTE